MQITITVDGETLKMMDDRKIIKANLLVNLPKSGEVPEGAEKLYELNSIISQRLGNLALSESDK